MTTNSSSSPSAPRAAPRLHLVHAGPAPMAPPALIGIQPTQGTLALAFDLPTGVPCRPERPDLRLAPAAAEDDLAELKSWAGMLGLAFFEVLAGLRPASQLTRWTSRAVSRQLARHQPEPARSAKATRARVTSVHVDRPAAGVVEAAVILQQAGRVRAAALRLESVQQRWVCTAISVG